MVGSKKKNNSASENQKEAGKKQYTKPKLTSLGSIQTLTLGSGGSSLDGNCSNTQLGGGNDGRGPKPC